MVTRKEIYEGAADIIERGGWGRGHYRFENEDYVSYGQHTDNTVHCAVGAVESACAEQGMSMKEMLTFTNKGFFRPLYEVTGAKNITVWNDKVARDAADVVNHLRKAGELCE